MITVKVNLKDNAYDIVIGHGILEDLGAALRSLTIGQDALVITHPVIRRLHGKTLATGLKRNGFSVRFLEVPAGERSKSFPAAIRLIQQIAQSDVKKGFFIVAFGGGVIGDLAGYVACAYKRGIPYVQVPTTLLAQIDSAIGGKVAIDLAVGKNLVGAFYQPKLVYSDVAVLSTLSRRQIRNGLAEAVKYGIICDPHLFATIEKNVAGLLALDSQIITELVAECSRIKARVVVSDEKETKGMRTILNFGHTTGHAIEAADQYRNYHHGEAVAIGMRVAAEISRRLKYLDIDSVRRIEQILTDIGLPERIQKVSLSSIMKHMEHDKKFQAGKNRFVLVTRIGSVKVMEGLKRSVIQAAMRKFMS